MEINSFRRYSQILSTMNYVLRYCSCSNIQIILSITLFQEVTIEWTEIILTQMIHYYHWYLRATSLCGSVFSFWHWWYWCSLERHLYIKWWCSPLVNIEMYPYWASLVAQLVKNLPAIQETLVWFLGWEDPMGEGIATLQYSCLGESPWTEEPGGLQSMGVTKGWTQLGN